MSLAIDLKAYRHVVFFTGAGMSAESGVPTYRGRGGIWHEYNYQDYACQRAFNRDPQKVLDFHERRRGKVLECEPHAGHHHLARLQAAHPGISVITQNIDGLMQRAGVKVAAELHGSLWRMRCSCGLREDTAAGAYMSRRCGECGAWLRPDITWFEDGLNAAVFDIARRLCGSAELFVSVGTSGVVWPAAGLVPYARDSGARMIEINPEETEASALHGERLREPAATAIPRAFPLAGQG